MCYPINLSNLKTAAEPKTASIHLSGFTVTPMKAFLSIITVHVRVRPKACYERALACYERALCYERVRVQTLGGAKKSREELSLSFDLSGHALPKKYSEFLVF